MKDDDVDILLVEDNPDDEELTLITFAEHKIANRIAVMHDGVEALDYIFCRGHYQNRHIEEMPQLILLDLKLPKLNGMQVLAQIKGDARTKMIPVVILTSSREEPDIERCYQLGANSYIVKPVDFDQFKQVIKQLGFYWRVVNQAPRLP